MKLTDLLTNREIRVFGLRGVLGEEVSLPAPQGSSYRYDQIAKAVYDKARDILRNDPGFIYTYNPDLGVALEENRNIAKDLEKKLSLVADNERALVSEITKLFSDYNLDRVKSIGVEPLIGYLAVALLDSLYQEEGIEDSGYGSGLNRLGQKIVDENELRKTIREGMNFSINVISDVFFAMNGGYEGNKLPDAFWRFLQQERGALWEREVKDEIERAALNEFSIYNPRPTKAEVWGWMDEYARNKVAPAIYKTFLSQQYEGWKPQGGTK